MLLQHAMRLLEGVSLSANVGEPTKAQIREVFMSHGFTVKEGQTDLKQYVYDAAYALLALAAPQHTQAASELRRLHAENITLQSSTVPADVAGTSERWRERWHGSPTEQGWSIMHGRECIAYLGPDVSSEAVSAIVAAHNAAPTTQAAPAAHGDALSWLQANDMAALERFAETTDDDESYDIGKDAVQRLAGFGCLRSHGFGKYSITDFGHYVLNDWSLARELPFKSQSERANGTGIKKGDSHE